MCVELGVARRTLTAGKEGTSTAAPLCYSFLLATLACNKLQLTLASCGTSGSSQECHELPPPPSLSSHTSPAFCPLPHTYALPTVPNQSPPLPRCSLLSLRSTQKPSLWSISFGPISCLSVAIYTSRSLLKWVL